MLVFAIGDQRTGPIKKFNAKLNYNATVHAEISAIAAASEKMTVTTTNDNIIIFCDSQEGPVDPWQ